MNYYDILFARKMAGGQGEITTEGLSVTENGTYTAPEGKAYTPVVVNVSGYKIKDIPNTPTAIATFNASALPMPSIKVGIEPQQDLHGYDAPWVGGAGKNKVDININTSQYSSTWTFPTPITQTVTVSAKKNNVVTSENVWLLDVVFQDDTHVYVGDTGYSNPFPQTITVNANNPITKINYRNYGLTSGSYDIQVELGSTATAYEPYSNICPISGWDEVNVTVANDVDNPTTSHEYTIDLDGTRYGGKLDVVSGVLTVDKGYIASYNGETLPSTWISDRDVYVEGTSPTTGAQVVYELATPITYQFTPTAVKSLLGTNNIWADTGDVLEGSYFKEL